MGSVEVSPSLLYLRAGAGKSAKTSPGVGPSPFLSATGSRPTLVKRKGVDKEYDLYSCTKSSPFLHSMARRPFGVPRLGKYDAPVDEQTIARRLRELRKRRGLTQVELAGKVGI